MQMKYLDRKHPVEVEIISRRRPYFEPHIRYPIIFRKLSYTLLIYCFGQSIHIKFHSSGIVRSEWRKQNSAENKNIVLNFHLESKKISQKEWINDKSWYPCIYDSSIYWINIMCKAWKALESNTQYKETNRYQNLTTIVVQRIRTGSGPATICAQNTHTSWLNLAVIWEPTVSPPDPNSVSVGKKNESWRACPRVRLSSCFGIIKRNELYLVHKIQRLTHPISLPGQIPSPLGNIIPAPKSWKSA